MHRRRIRIDTDFHRKNTDASHETGVCGLVGLIQVNYQHPVSSYYQRLCNMVFYVKCYVNTLSNNDKELYFSRLLSILL